MITLVDTHVHLHFPEFQSDVAQVIEQARGTGIRYLINVGTDVASSRQAIRVAEQYEFVYATVGIHPHDAKDVRPGDLDQLRELARHPKVVAVGEVGLDFFRNLSPESVQKKILVELFELAQGAHLPLILHIREAYETMIELLKVHFKPPIRALSHCFSGTVEMMNELLALGMTISFAGPITYKKNDALREAVRACPQDRILLETDAPFLAPQAHRGKRNEPAFMLETARWMADLRGISLEEVGRMTSHNAEAFFGRKFIAREDGVTGDEIDMG